MSGWYEQPDGSVEDEFGNKKIPTWKAQVVEAYSAGLKEGARRERRALKRWADGNRQLGQSPYNAHVSAQDINDWLAARSKAKPRLEGK